MKKKLPSLAYELKPGSSYLIEVKQGSVSHRDLQLIAREFKDYNIHVVFVFSLGTEFAFKAVPPKPSTKDRSRYGRIR